jgi:general secretion pathway protein G
MGVVITNRRGFHSVGSLRRSRAFTLIEILVVVVILSVLAAVIVPNVVDKPEEARVAKATSDIGALVTALDLYRLDYRVYPTTDQGLDALLDPPARNGAGSDRRGEGYVKKLQQDPWGRDYQYLNPGVRSAIDVYSLGPDGVPGDDDIGNWQ